MAYSIVELQTDINGNTISTPNQHEADHDEALSKWHLTCSYAAKSSVYIHAVLLIGERGNLEQIGEFIHAPEPEPEPEPEPDGNGREDL